MRYIQKKQNQIYMQRKLIMRSKIFVAFQRIKKISIPKLNIPEL